MRPLQEIFDEIVKMLEMKNPQEKLKEIKEELSNHVLEFSPDSAKWLIARVEQLEKALKLARKWISDDDPDWPVWKEIDKALNTGPKPK